MRTILPLLLAVCGTLSAAPHPNVLFILADDLGVHDLGSAGSTFYETPNLDALAASGQQFDQAYATCQVCSPSRASIFLGTYPARHGITDWIGAASGTGWKRNTKLLPAEYVHALPAEGTSLAEAFHENGYRTFFAGKWHLGGTGSLPTDHGFDINVAGNHKGSPPGGFYSPYNNPYLSDGPPGEPLPIRLAAETSDFISKHHSQSPGTPFFAFLSFYAVHAPLQTTPELWEKYRAKAPVRDRPRFKADRTLPVRQVQDHPVYAGLLETMDTAIGNVLETVESLGLDGDTIVVFTSDHGGVSSGDAYATSNLPLRGGKGRQWEGGFRVPLFFRVPGKTEPGSRSSTPVTGADLFPTLLELADLPPIPDQQFDGVSIFHENAPDRALFWHYPHYGNQGGEPSAVIRSGNWKLIHYYEDGRNELYNLKSDPEEMKDVAGSNRVLARELHQQITDWLEETNAKLPVTNPNFDAGAPAPDRIPKLERAHAKFLDPEWKPNPTWWGSDPE